MTRFLLHHDGICYEPRAFPGDTLWSDGPADVLAEAIYDVVEAFMENEGRAPTWQEVENGWRNAMLACEDVVAAASPRHDEGALSGPHVIATDHAHAHGGGRRGTG